MKHRGSSKRPPGGRGSARARAIPRARAATTVVLPPECTLSQVDGLKRQLAALSRQAQTVTVEVGELRRIDTASLQLLAAFVRDRSATALPVRITGKSTVFAEAMRLLGLASVLQSAASPTGA